MNDERRPARNAAANLTVTQRNRQHDASHGMERLGDVLPHVLTELAAGAEDEFVAAQYRRLARRSFAAQARQAA